MVQTGMHATSDVDANARTRRLIAAMFRRQTPAPRHELSQMPAQCPVRPPHARRRPVVQTPAFDVRHQPCRHCFSNHRRKRSRSPQQVANSSGRAAQRRQRPRTTTTFQDHRRHVRPHNIIRQHVTTNTSISTSHHIRPSRHHGQACSVVAAVNHSSQRATAIQRQRVCGSTAGEEKCRSGGGRTARRARGWRTAARQRVVAGRAARHNARVTAATFACAGGLNVPYA